MAHADYVVAIDVLPMDWGPLSVGGTLLVNPSGSIAELHWKQGSSDYRLELEHGPIEDGAEQGIRASLKMNEVEYSALAVYRFDDRMKAIDVKLRTEKYFTLTVVVSVLVQQEEAPNACITLELQYYRISVAREAP